jgi:hypothetical protein
MNIGRDTKVKTLEARLSVAMGLCQTHNSYGSMIYLTTLIMTLVM